MHEMQTIVTDDCGVCLSVSLSDCHVAQLCGAFDAAFAKSLWALVIMMIAVCVITTAGYGVQ